MQIEWHIKEFRNDNSASSWIKICYLNMDAYMYGQIENCPINNEILTNYCNKKNHRITDPKLILI